MSQKSELVPKRRFKEFENAGDWEQRKVDEIADMFDNLRVPVKASDRSMGHIPYYGANGIQDYVDGFTHDGEFVLIAEDGANDLINYPVHYVNGKVWVNNHAHVLSGKQSELSNLFLLPRIKSMNILSILVGGGRAKLNADVLKKLNVQIPSVKEQNRIGIFFRKLDDTITLHQRKLNKLNNIKQSYLYQMFPQNGEKVPKMRFAGFSGDWKQRELSGMIEKVIDNRGKTPPLDLEGGYPMIEVAALGNLYPDYSKVIKYVNEETFKSWFRGYLQEGDLLFSTVGNTGLTSLMDDNNKAVIAQNIIGMRFTEKYSSNFMNQLFKLRDSMEKVKQIEMGAVQPSVKVSQLIHLKYYVPSLEEQQKIGQFFKQLDETIDIQEQELEKLKNLKEAYLNEMFV